MQSRRGEPLGNRVDKMTDDEVEAAALSDPDAQPLTDEQLARAFRPRKLVELRQRLGLDQAEFARRFRIDLDTLKGWERGWVFPEISSGSGHRAQPGGGRRRA
jgi:putative transcriptional regulator